MWCYNRMIKKIASFTLSNMNINSVNATKLLRPSRICTDKNVMFIGGYNSHIIDKFPNTKTLILNNCEKNFVYYNLNSRIFPNLEKVYSDSHPCDPDVLHRFANNPKYQAFLVNNYYIKYNNRWWDKNHPYIVPISDEYFNAYISSHDLMEPTFE